MRAVSAAIRDPGDTNVDAQMRTSLTPDQGGSACLNVAACLEGEMMLRQALPFAVARGLSHSATTSGLLLLSGCGGWRNWLCYVNESAVSSQPAGP
ncbi:hypothetical protein [Candidatus Amarolinea dominans]|uniref:hypothetical protein n=1 Tax=Candidatus Amarolinea dominans TaxID=3140696 RepID=UPI003136D7C1|nr:hypothetical protein [Anaerolineae bacterium]